MLKMFFVLIFSVTLFSTLNCKPLMISSLKLFNESNCTIPLSILESKFKGINNTSPNSFLMPLQECKTMEINNVSKLCEETFAVLYNISTCNKDLITDVNFEYEISDMTEISGDMCNDFQNQTSIGNDSQNIESILKNRLACDLICEEKMHICNVLLWGYKVQRLLRGLADESKSGHTTGVSSTIVNEINQNRDYVDSKNKRLEKTTHSVINQLMHSASVTPFSIHPPLMGGMNVNNIRTVNSPTVEGRKVDPLNNQISDDKFQIGKQKMLKVDSMNQNKIIEIQKLKTNPREIKKNLVQNTNTSQNESKKKTNLKSTKAVQPNNNKLKNISLPDNLKIDTNNHSLDGKISDLVPKLNQSNPINNAIPNDDEDSNTEVENLSANEDDDYPILDNLPQRKGQDSEIANPKSSAKFRIGYERLVTKIDNHQEESTFISSMENRPFGGNSTNFIKTSNATFLVEDVNIKSQEYESNDQFPTNAVQPTHQKLISDDLPSAVEEPSNVVTDEASKRLTENEKSVLNQPMFNDPDYDFPTDGGGETQRFDISASKFAEGTFRSENEIIFPKQENPHFFFYFFSIILIVVTCYLVFHNKQKIIALIVEGCHERRRRPHGVNYRKLETK